MVSRTAAIAIALGLVGGAYLLSKQSKSVTQQWIDKNLAAYKPASINPIMFTGEDLSGSFLYPELYPQDVYPFLTMLYSLGVQSIRVDMDYYGWLKPDPTIITNNATQIANIRSNNKKLILSDYGSQLYVNKPISWSQFKTAWLSRVSTLAALYQPDYYVMVKEPAGYAKMVSDSSTNPLFSSSAEWLTLSQDLASAIKGVSANTQIGVTASPQTNSSSFITSFFEGIKQISNISFFGFDIYDQASFDTMISYMDRYGAGTKNFWLAETWSNNTGPNSVGYATIDPSWIQLMYYVAEYYHAEEFNPWFSNAFVDYSWPPSTFTVGTPVGLEYQHIIQTNLAGQFP